jgi:hypothetical protein
LGILGRSQQVRGFDQAHEFVRWDHRYRLLALPADNYDLAIIRDAIEYGGEALSEIGVCGFRQVCLPGTLYRVPVRQQQLL